MKKCWKYNKPLHQLFVDDNQISLTKPLVIRSTCAVKIGSKTTDFFTINNGIRKVEPLYA